MPKGTAQAIVDRLSSEIQAATQDPETRARRVKLGADPVGGTPAEFATFIVGPTRHWAQLIQSDKISAD